MVLAEHLTTATVSSYASMVSVTTTLNLGLTYVKGFLPLHLPPATVIPLGPLGARANIILPTPAPLRSHPPQVPFLLTMILVRVGMAEGHRNVMENTITILTPSWHCRLGGTMVDSGVGR